MSNGSSVVACPHCGGRIVAEERIAGREVGCPHCNGRVIMPAVAPTLSPALPAAPVESWQTDPFDFLPESAVMSRPQSRSVSLFSETRPTYRFSRKNVNSSFWFWVSGPAIIISAIIICLIAVVAEFIKLTD
jgi:DNA-directed RNA polymerase subunit RPC12/RpoP